VRQWRADGLDARNWRAGTAASPAGQAGSPPRPFYDGAALRHCCRLLYEIEVAAAAALELSVRMLGRAHMEAWLVALYIHFGGYEALLKVAQDARHSLEGIELEARQFDEWLAAEKTAARKSGRKVATTNGGIEQWNEKNPDVPPKPLLDEPYVPQLSSAGLDLSSLIDGFGPHEAQGLSVSEIVDTLTKWGPEKGFSRESFRPIYLIYRTLSAIGTHASMHILDAYFVPGGFIRVAPMPVNGSASDSVRATSLYGTAFSARNPAASTGKRRPELPAHATTTASCPSSTDDSGRQARGQAVVGEVGGQERHDLGHSPVLDAEDVEPGRYVSAGVVVPQVGAECELAVCRCR
jgi:hypothetical protein